MSAQRKTDIQIGNRYGHLVVVDIRRRPRPNGYADAQSYCRCDCGKLSWISDTRLRQGREECPNVEINALLGRSVWLTGWNTPTSPVNTNGHQAGNNRYVTSVTDQTKSLTVAIRGKLQSDGSMLIGSCAEILPENQAGAPLNPEHSRWIMRLPVEWASCAPTVTRSTRKQRQTSVKSSEKSSMIYDL